MRWSLIVLAVIAFAANLLAGITGHRPQEFFTLDDERQREGPQVSFS